MKIKREIFPTITPPNTQVESDIVRLKAEKEENLIIQLDEVKGIVDEKTRRTIELACESSGFKLGFITKDKRHMATDSGLKRRSEIILSVK